MDEEGKEEGEHKIVKEEEEDGQGKQKQEEEIQDNGE